MQGLESAKKLSRGRRWILVISVLFLAIVVSGGVVMASACAAVGASAQGSRLERILASPQFRGGTFVNTIPPREPEFLKTAAEYFAGTEHTTPDEPVPVIRRDRDELGALPSSGLRVTWFGHSSSLVSPLGDG